MAAALMLAAFGMRPAHAIVEAESCGPFGDSPARMIGSVVPKCDEGTTIGPWNDADGTARYACLYQPPTASPSKPLPLIVYLHPSLADAGSTSRYTNLLDFLKTANVSDDPSRPGFILLAPQGRNTSHYYSAPDRSGTGWDYWYRQFSADGTVKRADKYYAENVDAATIDHFIEAIAATGMVDRNRVYLTGWSNGGGMAYLYGLNRPKIAAVAVYSAANPLRLRADPCPQDPVAGAPTDFRQLQVTNPKLPTYQVHNSCDIGGICPNVLQFEKQLAALGAVASDTIIDRNQRATPDCSTICGSDPNGGVENPLGVMIGMAHHLRWPRPWTAAMLDFFRRHPLAPAKRNSDKKN